MENLEDQRIKKKRIVDMDKIDFFNLFLDNKCQLRGSTFHFKELDGVEQETAVVTIVGVGPEAVKYIQVSSMLRIQLEGNSPEFIHYCDMRKELERETWEGKLIKTVVEKLLRGGRK